jgi:hypothetical protein
MQKSVCPEPNRRVNRIIPIVKYDNNEGAYMNKKLYLIYIIVVFGLMAFILLRNFSMFSSSTAGEYYSKYVETKAVVKQLSIPNRVVVRRRSSQIPAIITYKTLDGKSIETSAMVMRIPFYGVIAKEGNEITVFYNPSKPAEVRTYADKFNIMGGFGLFILGGVVVIVCLFIAVKRIMGTKA